MLRRRNESLPGLVLGIVLYGLMVQLILIFLPIRRVPASIGLWYGVIIACGMAVNLASVIYDSVMLGDEKAAKAKAIVKSVLRYVLVCVLFFLLGLFNFGNLYTALIGVLGLKVSAYMQPLMARISRRLFGENFMYPMDHPEEEQEDPETEKKDLETEKNDF